MRIVVIPARGGSQRIPFKNIKVFLGEPVISYPIRMAIRSEIFDHVFVSTDNEEIAAIAEDYGAEVPFIRSAELADDNVGTKETIIDVIDRLKNMAPLDLVCCLYPVTPLLSSSHLREGLALVSEPDTTFSFAATRYSHPIERSFVLDSKRGAELTFPGASSAITNDFEPKFHDAGQFYWGSVKNWKEKSPLLGPKSKFIELRPWEGIDVDTIDDWKTLELLALGLRFKNS